MNHRLSEEPFQVEFLTFLSITVSSVVRLPQSTQAKIDVLALCEENPMKAGSFHSCWCH